MKTWPDFEKFLRSSFGVLWVSEWVVWLLIFGRLVQMKKVSSKCNWPVFCAQFFIAHRNDAWLFDYHGSKEKWRKTPKHQNGLTKCKRHVITNQLKKFQTTINVPSMQPSRHWRKTLNHSFNQKLFEIDRLVNSYKEEKMRILKIQNWKKITQKTNNYTKFTATNRKMHGFPNGKTGSHVQRKFLWGINDCASN